MISKQKIMEQQKKREDEKHTQDLELFMQNSVFKYKKYSNTIFVPVYPRAYIQEVIGIDYDRRTVTANFVIHITVRCKVNNKDLNNFIRTHLILQFGYNQTIYIPQTMRQDNPSCIITEVFQAGNSQEFVTYKIRGNLECSANFDLMFFPFRQIEVNNHLVIRSQHFKEFQIKYNAMMLKNDTVWQFNQFSPHITFPEFAGYSIMHFSTEMSTDESKYQMKTNRNRDQLWSYLSTFLSRDKQKLNKPKQVPVEQVILQIFHMNVQQDKLNNLKRKISRLNQQNQSVISQFLIRQIFSMILQQNQKPSKVEDLQELSPYKHVLFKFEMMSLKPAFVLQNEVPIWVLAVLSLFTFTSSPDIGNRYGNIILLIVSYVGLFINFRINNVSHSSFTFYEIKLIVIMIVPILLIISTVLDYYSNSDQNLTNWALRQSQIDNPFMLASLIIVLFCFIVTLVFIFHTAITKYLQFWIYEKPTKASRNQSESMWQNLTQLEWKQPKLFVQMIKIAKKSQSNPFEMQEQQVKKGISSIIMKKVKSMILPKNQEYGSPTKLINLSPTKSK